MSIFSKKDIGDLGERLAARYLKKNGYRILAKNAHFGKNELDLVVKNEHVIAFVEVKTLTFEDPEKADRRPSEAVDIGKRRRTVQAAYAYLRAHPTKRTPRLDVVEVYLNRATRKAFQIIHIPAAFDANGRIQ